MTDILMGVALFILAVTALGLFRVLTAHARVERMMAVQLLGTGGAAVALLMGAASRAEPMVDVALLLVLVSSLSCAAFTLGQSSRSTRADTDRVEKP